MRSLVIIFCLLMLVLTPGPAPWAWHANLAAQDAGDTDDDDDTADDDDNEDVADPDDQDPGENDPGGDDVGGDDVGGDDVGGDDVGGDDPSGDDAGGDDAGGDDTGGDDAGAGDDVGDDDGATGDDDDGAAGGDDDNDGGTTGGNDDDGTTGGNDDDDDGANGGNDDDDDGATSAGDDNDDSIGSDDDQTDDRGETDNGAEDLDDDPGQWLLANGEREAERAALDERDRIDTDGDGFRYRRGEFIALDLTAADIAELRKGGFEVLATEKLASVEGTVLLLRGPARLSDEAALDALDVIADPDTVGYNHLFDSSSVQTKRSKASNIPQRTACGCQIGLIDTGIATDLAYFKHVTLSQRAFNAKAPQAALHGTAVAHLMAGTKPDPAARTKIVVADIFAGPRETAGSSFALIKALDWLAAQGVPVINISLSGPRNPAVAGAIARITKRGHVIVAAAGNDGPAAPPVFPGAYANVVGVTAVDAQNRVYRYANRGEHVDFAARGVAVPAIDAKGGLRDATGTSFAAPVVAARLARQLTKPDPAAAQKAIQALEGQARDLGARGRDPIYGAGLIGGEQ